MFVDAVKKRFDVGKAILDQTMLFNGCRITQHMEGNITLHMEEYMRSIKMMEISRERRKQHTEKATKTDYDLYRSIDGSVIWAGNGEAPYA